MLMIGTVFTHLKAGEGPQTILALVLLTVLAVVSYARRPRTPRFKSQIDYASSNHGAHAGSFGLNDARSPTAKC